MLKEYIEELVNEVLRGFNFNKFRAISGTNHREDDYHVKKELERPEKFLSKSKEQEYAEQFLPFLGKGSSRVTFAFSGGKVLKIATNQAGYGQNKAEVQVWTFTQSSIVTEVYDHSPDYKWIISEIVKPFPIFDFFNSLGINYHQWQFMAGLYKLRSFEDFKTQINEKILYYNESIVYLNKQLEDPRKLFPYEIARNKETIEEHQVEIEDLQNIFSNEKFLSFMENLINLVNGQKLEWGDIVPKHFGRTVKGEIKLLDYGYNDEVSDKFY